ncbi:transcriptional regulator with XRE-family HTH domain [Sedimentibacter acidaminivorans]|uniref:Transcriptional regulator with XRE-family HTH domain n=1 Tax=Sedimentibacter acidaminivorans TaxID=913099 RepID=A0ABS4GDS3_9FIRM|nr:helix-turn-helix domain-containing protein [Sedimentibacter acidaminivorans]MBP1925853.1 transcriptional regulator with XRE-family HTH domain [Sedimentibacter acidaminivorans]
MKDNKLREIRASKGLSQFDLSMMTRIPPSEISRLENGKIYAYPGWRRKISDALNIPEENIFLNE